MIRKTLLAAAIAGLALQAQAANVVINIGSDAFDAGSLAGQKLTGTFSFDDTALTAATEWLPLSSFSFTLDSQTYTIGSDVLGGDPNFAPRVLFIGGAVLGLEASVDATDKTIGFVPGFDLGGSYVFALGANPSPVDYGTATLTFTAAVPEPESYALMLGGLGVVGWLARRRKA